MTDATPEQIVAFLTGKRTMTADIFPMTKEDLITELRAEVERLTALLTASEALKRGYLDEVERLQGAVDQWKRLALQTEDAMARQGNELRAEVERLNALVATMANDLTKAGARELDRLAEVDELRDEVREWKDRYEAERRDHLATIKHADALEDECHKLERE